MSLALYQIIVPCIAGVFILRAFSNFIRHRRTIRELVAVSGFWSGLAAFSIFPDALAELAQFIGIKDYINGITFFSLGLLFYAVFKILLALYRNEKQITRLVRKEALAKVKE
ncbi:DUF2304 domain-containing protein [Candidatus Dojkabacteria bacterium]|uniref:DUF2304 domain-containing protein n=1 Tax=Candidatus Dojkabacteria bacterium TaxID=2099670 RepID=A0A955RJP9_9BACT|nr:DUF2304 domain-containing protein [Candidatus Dojkabacteria bacterium]